MKRISLLIVLIIGAFAMVGCEGTAGQPAVPYERPTSLPTRQPAIPPTETTADTEEGTAIEEPSRVITPTNVLGRDASIVVLADTNASYTNALEAVGKTFETAYPEITVSFVFTSTEQLPDPLPADVYASLSKESMNAAVEAGQVVSETTRVFAQDVLIIVVNKEKAEEITNIRELATPDIKVVLVDEESQYGGRATFDFLNKMNSQIAMEDGLAEGEGTYRDDVLANATFVESVQEVIRMVASGEADAGITFQSSLTPDIADKVQRVEIAYDLNVPTVYPIGVVNTSNEQEAAKLFVDFVVSPVGQEILWENGTYPAE